MNIISLVGRLTADPELKHTKNGVAVTRFTIAVDRPYTKLGEERAADFINIVAWQGSAEFVTKHFVRGQRIGVVGSVRTGSYMDNDGIKRYTFEVHAERLEFVEYKEKQADPRESPESSQYAQGSAVTQYETVPYSGDLPF